MIDVLDLIILVVIAVFFFKVILKYIEIKKEMRDAKKPKAGARIREE